MKAWASLAMATGAACAPWQQLDLEGGRFQGTLHTFTSNLGGNGNGFSPLRHASYPGVDLFGRGQVGLFFEHVTDGAWWDQPRAHFSPNRDFHALTPDGPAAAFIRHHAAASSWGLDTQMHFRLQGDAVDMEFTATPARDAFAQGYALLMWANYLHHARERAFHFYGTRTGQDGIPTVEWQSFGATPDESGVIGAVGTLELPGADGRLDRNVPQQAHVAFNQPFFYGLVDGDGDPDTTSDTMAMVFMFDRMEDIRFALWSFTPDDRGKVDPSKPAWDWQFIIRQPRQHQSYRYRARLLYVPFTGPEDVRAAYFAWRASLPPQM